MIFFKNFIFVVLIILSPSVLGSDADSLINYFENHTILHLVGWLFFPRMMFWFVSSLTGGFLFWTGVVLFPRIMVAYWSTELYWSTNPVLCIVAWFVAFTGESLEKSVISDSV
jgi:hypothetical protein